MQRLVKLQTLAKPMNTDELACEVISVLQVVYGISSNQLLACMHDRASVNGAAMRTIKVVFPSLVDIGCYSHTIDLAGEKFDVPVVQASTVHCKSCRNITRSRCNILVG